MLAQSFKTAEELGLNDTEHGALVKVLGMLERGELKHGKNFDMSEWHCGTAGCIGGWADKIIGMEMLNERGENDQLSELFFARRTPRFLHEITDSQAAIALRSYLTTGDANWVEAMS